MNEPDLIRSIAVDLSTDELDRLETELTARHERDEARLEILREILADRADALEHNEPGAVAELARDRERKPEPAELSYLALSFLLFEAQS